MSEEKLTLGQYFKREREKREITLKEIEQTTKIPAQTLKFLEEDQIDVLPPRAFLRGFLQVIAKEFDFDEEELIRHLDETLSAYGKKEDPKKSRFMNDGRGKSMLLRVLVVVFLLLILIAAVGFSVRTCSTTYQTSSLPQGYAEIERADTGHTADA
jgi:cytoskeletal protein RodZ